MKSLLDKMFKRKKDKTKEKDAQSGSSSNSTTTILSSNTSNIVIKRIDSSYSSSSYSNTTKGSAATSNGLTAQSSNFEFKTPFPTSITRVAPSRPSALRSPYKPRSISVFETDARPIESTLGQLQITPNYQTRFPRNTPSYSSIQLPVTSTPAGSRFLNAQPRVIDVSNSSITPVVPTYNQIRRGYVTVINNKKFLTNNEERKGSEKDEIGIFKLFTDMGFEVKLHKNLKASEMRSKIKKHSTNRDLRNMDISVIIMMSHGSNRNANNQLVHNNFTQILGVDGEGLPIEDVIAEFSSDKCPLMKGKPKIFIFQCCRGCEQELCVDDVPIKSPVKSHADVLIAYSTLPGFFSLRDPTKGTWYIQSICDVFSKHANTFDVETLLKIVDDQLSNKHPQYSQTSTYESRGFKRCFLKPQ